MFILFILEPVLLLVLLEVMEPECVIEGVREVEVLAPPDVFRVEILGEDLM